jgi:hypothetical protein
MLCSLIKEQYSNKELIALSVDVKIFRGSLIETVQEKGLQF